MGIEEAKEEIQELVDMYGSKHDRDDFNIISNFIKKQKAELEKKDKVINEMATTIVDEGIFADRCQCKIDADECDENCEKCIMEHFINKVEREGK